MNKYNKVMENITVSEEMEKRVLGNVSDHFNVRKKSRRALYTVLTTFAAAAMILLLVRPWRDRPVVSGENEKPSLTAGSFQTRQYRTIKELSEAAGFEMQDIDSIPFEVTEKVFEYHDGTAAIVYSCDGEALTFMKARDKDDPSSDRKEYADVKTASIHGIDVTLKGEAERICLAVWKENEFAYALRDPSGLREEEALRIIEEIINENE